MPKLQCPKCKQMIELSSIPANNRVTCASCKAEFALKTPAAKPVATAAASGSKPIQAAVVANASTTGSKQRPVDPNDPFASIDLNTLGKGNRVDLGVAHIPTGVAESPQGNAAPWLPGNAPVYVPLTEAEAAELTKSGGKPKAAGKGKPQPPAPKINMGVTIAVGALLALMAGGAIVAAVIVGSAGSGGGKATAERPKFRIPDGFEIVTIKGVDGIMPKSDGKKAKVPGGFEGRIAESPKTGSYFVFGVTDQLGGEINADKVSKAVRNMLHGDVLGGQEITVAGHKGWQGSYSTGIFLPDRTTIEMIPIEDRFIIRGYITASSQQDGFTERKFDHEAERAELEMFKESIFIGKKPGWFGG